MKSGLKIATSDRNKLIKIENPPNIQKSKTITLGQYETLYSSMNKTSSHKLFQNTNSRGSAHPMAATSKKLSSYQIQSPVAATGMSLTHTGSASQYNATKLEASSPKSPTAGTFTMAPISATNERAWLKKHGKQRYIDFDAKEIKQLREYFDSLDEDGSGRFKLFQQLIVVIGSIGVDQLEDPLIALGLAQSKEKVAEIIKSVDEDGSGQIQFAEFLSIIKKGAVSTCGSSDQKNDQQAAIYKFFKDMTEGNLKTRQLKTMPFRLYISHFRRQMLMASIKSKDPDLKQKGDKIMKAYTKQLASNQLKQKIMQGGMVEQLKQQEEQLFNQDVPKQKNRDGVSDMPFLQNQFKRIMLTKIS